MARAYALVRGRRLPHRRLDLRRRAARDRASHRREGRCVQDNQAVGKPVLASDQAAIVNQLLQGVVQGGTGTAAALPGREVAGKTGTTENFGDAWFVGYTPQLVAAVWVGYPDKLIPMTTEFHGHAVAGGTFPALIWKAFMSKALDQLKLPPENFDSAAVALRGAGDGRQPRRRARARRRRLQELLPARVLRRRAGPSRRSRPASRTRSRSRTSSAARSARRRRASTASRSRRRSSTSRRAPASGSATWSASSRARGPHRPTTRSR